MERQLQRRQTFGEPRYSRNPFFRNHFKKDNFSPDEQDHYSENSSSSSETVTMDAQLEKEPRPEISKEKNAEFRKELFELFQLFDGKVVRIKPLMI